MSVVIGFDAPDAFRVAAAMTATGVQAGVRANVVTRYHGLLLQTKVKANASKPRSGPPGPRIITGDYNRSIGLAMGLDGLGNPQAIVGTNKPQGRRLEFGFTGTDSLGRHYDQPPYPHFRPALDEVEPLFVAAIAGIVE